MSNTKLWNPGITEINSQRRALSNTKCVSKQFVRAISKHQKGSLSGNFQCPGCREYFALSYARFGKFEVFEDAQYWCRDCSDIAGFILIK